jgi:hypothetical protein
MFVGFFPRQSVNFHNVLARSTIQLALANAWTCAGRYHYRILAGTGLLSVFEKDRAWHVPEELDLADMQVCPLISPHL